MSSIDDGKCRGLLAEGTDQAELGLDHEEVSVAEFAQFAYGKGLPASLRNAEGDIPVYGSNGIIGYHDAALTGGPTVIIGRKGTVGSVHYSSQPCWPIDTTFYCEDDDPELLRFKYYALSSLRLDQMNSDSAVPGLSRSHAHSLRLRVPPRRAQRTVARVLGALDDRIELSRRMSETLKEMARTLFRSWFVDFDPVRAKSEGRPTGLPPDLEALFPSTFLDSGRNPIPAGWLLRSLDSIANFSNGLALQRFPPDGPYGLPVIKIAEMRRGYTHKTGRASCDIDSRYIVEDGDMLFSWSGSLEVVLWSHGRGALNQHLFKVTSDDFPLWFYWGWTLEHLDEFRRIAAGKATTMGHIRRHHLRDATVVAPPNDVLSQLDLVFLPMLNRSIDLARKTRELAAVRDLLLPELVSGRLQVAEPMRLPTVPV